MLTATPPEGQQWRKALMTRLAQLLLNPKLPELLRNRALQALVNSDEAAVGTFLQQIASHSDAHLRAGAMMGLGALEREQDLPLIEAALQDSKLQVRLAAINALGRLSLAGNKHASELIMATMIESGDEVQRVAAELLADMGPEGESMLREASTDEDLMLRRASVYGLAIINEPWTREALELMRSEDKEWLVRNAAANALEIMSADEEPQAPSLDISLPQADMEPWLIALAAERGEGVGTGKAAEDTLLRALEDDDPNVRLMAIETVERLALPRAVNALRQLLRDSHPEIRHAALDALNEISRRHNLVISPG
jgi:HEAT repeat protein